MAKGNNSNIGCCGEYYVAAELERRGFLAVLTPANTPLFDIVAIKRDDPQKRVLIQVKTTFGKTNKWPLRKKNEEIKDKNTFYVFVRVENEKAPEFFIVPSRIVAEEIHNSHQKWLSTPGRYGQ